MSALPSPCNKEEGLLFFDSFADLLEHDMLGWEPAEPVRDDCEKVKQLPLVTSWDQSTSYQGRECGSKPRTLVCHDMMGGYLNYDKCTGTTRDPECHPYALLHWWYVDVFVYFSHHFVTVPPRVWIQQGHMHRVPVLGTLITEFDEGDAICKELFKSRESAELLAVRLVELCRQYTFEGWLVNIENPVEKDHLPHLVHFLRQLRSGLKEVIGRAAQVIWYDSVTIEGELKWQNELNEHNDDWFQLVDGIFLNYTWKEKNLLASYQRADMRQHDVYVGVDIFGRGCLGDGGWNCRLPVELIRAHDLSVALFAPGWISQRNAEKCFFDSSTRFWDELRGLVWPRPLTGIQIHTNFSAGFSRTCNTWFCASEAQLQPHYLESAKGELAVGLEALLLYSVNYITLFLCNCSIVAPMQIRLRASSSIGIRLTGCGGKNYAEFLAEEAEKEMCFQMAVPNSPVRLERIEAKMLEIGEKGESEEIVLPTKIYFISILPCIPHNSEKGKGKDLYEALCCGKSDKELL